MEEGGWIERRADAADRRVRTIHPTDKARDVYAEVKSLAVEVYEEALTGVSVDNRGVLIKVLETMTDNLSAGDQQSPAAAKPAQGAAA